MAQTLARRISLNYKMSSLHPIQLRDLVLHQLLVPNTQDWLRVFSQWSSVRISAILRSGKTGFAWCEVTPLQMMRGVSLISQRQMTRPWRKRAERAVEV